MNEGTVREGRNDADRWARAALVRAAAPQAAQAAGGRLARRRRWRVLQTDACVAPLAAGRDRETPRRTQTPAGFWRAGRGSPPRRRRTFAE
jgi:hypothetical protein